MNKTDCAKLVKRANVLDAAGRYAEADTITAQLVRYAQGWEQNVNQWAQQQGQGLRKDFNTGVQDVGNAAKATWNVATTPTRAVYDVASGLGKGFFGSPASAAPQQAQQPAAPATQQAPAQQQQSQGPTIDQWLSSQGSNRQTYVNTHLKPYLQQYGRNALYQHLVSTVGAHITNELMTLV
jgi:hypothetical protein